MKKRVITRCRAKLDGYRCTKRRWHRGVHFHDDRPHRWFAWTRDGTPFYKGKRELRVDVWDRGVSR